MGINYCNSSIVLATARLLLMVRMIHVQSILELYSLSLEPSLGEISLGGRYGYEQGLGVRTAVLDKNYIWLLSDPGVHDLTS